MAAVPFSLSFPHVQSSSRAHGRVKGRLADARFMLPSLTIAALAAVALIIAHSSGICLICGSAAAPQGHSARASRRQICAQLRCAGSDPRASFKGAPKVPKNEFRPKQSLGQNYLSDPNTISKITSLFVQSVRKRCEGNVLSGQVVELGSGLGAITHQIYTEFPTMTAVELDDRAIHVLGGQLPSLNILRQDMLELSYRDLANRIGGQVYVIGNLPYYIVSDVLLSLVRQPGAVRFAQLMVQSEVAQKIISSPGSKEYGVLAATLQLYTRPRRAFTVPPTAFYPRPKVKSAIVELDFLSEQDAPKIDVSCVREVISTSFQQRRKVLRHSLARLLQRERAGLPSKWAGLRAENMRPQDFVSVAQAIFPYDRVSSQR